MEDRGHVNSTYEGERETVGGRGRQEAMMEGQRSREGGGHDAAD